MQRLFNYRTERHDTGAVQQNDTHDLELATGTDCQDHLYTALEPEILSLFPAMRVPRFPATGDEIGECSRFANQGLRRETKRGPLQPRTT